MKLEGIPCSLILLGMAGVLALSCGFGDDDESPPPPPAQTPQMPPPPEPTPVATPSPASGQNGQQGIQIPGLGNIPIPVPNQANGQGGQNGQPNQGGQPNNGIQVPGLPGLNLPNPFPAGSNQGSNQPHARSEPPARGSLPPAPAGSFDTQGHLTRAFIENRATLVHGSLVSALGQQEKAQAQPIPFRIARDESEPNAAAGCTKSSNQAVMLITSAMLTLAAGISEAKAYDELSNTNTVDSYVNSVISQVRAKQPITAPSSSLFTGPNVLDQHKLSRQVHLFDQQVAFILGHELAHHYRGHTGCVTGRSASQVEVDDASRILARTVPLFSQPREVEADMWGIVNVLEAGALQSTGSWNEEGALLNLQFFASLRQRGGSNLAMLFFSTHPAPQFRIPIVRQTARQWRPGWRPMTTPGSSDGQGIRLPTPAGNIELPIPLPTGS